MDPTDQSPAYHYNAFLSYSHALHATIVPAVQRALSQFAKPWYRLRALRIYRDQTNLSLTPELWPTIQATLDRSEYLLLMASPEGAASKWVRREVDHWLITRDGTANLLIVLSRGNIVWDEERKDFDWSKTDALPDVLKGRFHEEPLYADLREVIKGSDRLSLKDADFYGAVLKLAAPLEIRSWRWTCSRTRQTRAVV